jgi:LacI family transcriptional regulator
MAEKLRRKVNIAEVARIAGVSKMTVSRIMNNTGQVAAATRLRIQQLIDELHYQPSPFAKGLASQTSRILGLMIFDKLDFGFFEPMFRGVEHEVRVKGYDLLILSHPEMREGRINSCLGMVAGVLCFGFDFDNDTIENIESQGIPYVLIGKREWRNAAPWYCTADYLNGFRRITHYLMDMGHKRIALMGISPDFAPDKEKHEGFKKALAEAGNRNGFVLNNSDVERIREVLENFRPTAVIMDGTIAPLPLLLCIREMGLRVPRDISLVYTRRDFIDIHTLYDFTGIHELTLMNIPRHKLGAEAVTLLQRLIAGEKNIPKEQSVKMEFVAGESCAPPRRARTKVPRREKMIKEELCAKR